jgi:hypothetical protein
MEQGGGAVMMEAEMYLHTFVTAVSQFGPMVDEAVSPPDFDDPMPHGNGEGNGTPLEPSGSDFFTGSRQPKIQWLRGKESEKENKNRHAILALLGRGCNTESCRNKSFTVMPVGWVVAIMAMCTCVRYAILYGKG